MDVEELLDRIPIEDYIAQYATLEKKGDEYFTKCLFHEENTASLSITPKNQCYYCFGCHAGGNLLKFTMKYHHLKFEDAITHLLAYAGLSDEIPVCSRLTATKIIKTYRPSKDTNKEATYKILEEDVMHKYEDNAGILMPWIDEGIKPEILHKYSVKYDALSQRIVFPIRSLGGEIVNISGRTVDKDWKEKKLCKYNYYGSMGRLDTFFGFFENAESIVTNKEIIIFEGAKSVMKLDGWGQLNSVAALTSRINPYQLKILIQLGCRVVFALDSEVDVKKIDTVKKLMKFVRVETVINYDGLLKEKMAPVDAGEDVWKTLYERRVRLN